MKRRITCCVALAAATVCAQGNSGYLAKPFEINANSVSRNFQGHDCAAITTRLKRVRVEKSEFETQAEYEQRAAKVATELSPAPGMGADDLLAFPISDIFSVAMRYDAGLRQANLHLMDSGMRLSHLGLTGVPLSSTTLTVRTVSESRRPFVGSNAFGVKVRAEAVHRKVCAIGLPGYSARQLMLTSHADIPMEPNAAKDLNENLSVIFIGRATPPYYASGRSHKGATIDSAIELTIDGDVIPLEVSEIWYYNRRTGIVAAKIKPTR